MRHGMLAMVALSLGLALACGGARAAPLERLETASCPGGVALGPAGRGDPKPAVADPQALRDGLCAGGQRPLDAAEQVYALAMSWVPDDGPAAMSPEAFGHLIEGLQEAGYTWGHPVALARLSEIHANGGGYYGHPGLVDANLEVSNCEFDAAATLAEGMKKDLGASGVLDKVSGRMLPTADAWALRPKSEVQALRDPASINRVTWCGEGITTWGAHLHGLRSVRTTRTQWVAPSESIDLARLPDRPPAPKRSRVSLADMELTIAVRKQIDAEPDFDRKIAIVDASALPEELKATLRHDLSFIKPKAIAGR